MKTIPEFAVMVIEAFYFGGGKKTNFVPEQFAFGDEKEVCVAVRESSESGFIICRKSVGLTPQRESQITAAATQAVLHRSYGMVGAGSG